MSTIPQSPTTRCPDIAETAARFRETRQRTVALCDPLTPEDMMVQSTPEASPVKWHLAHTAWFFESFILRDFLPGYRVFNPDFQWLFNSYYETLAKFPEKRLRSSFSRPGLDEVLRFRTHVDEGIERLLDGNPEPEALALIHLGVNHEEQHQELLLTDILHAFFTNPLRPSYQNDDISWSSDRNHGYPIGFRDFPGGLLEVGHGSEGFSFDNETPRHRVWGEPYSLADRLVTCAEYAAFMEDGGYRRPELWLSAGWALVKATGWRAPLYWTSESGDWSIFTLRGEMPFKRMEHVPVSHVSHFEADAYARWAGHRLATEFEWEAAAQGLAPQGNLLDSGRLLPSAAGNHASGLSQLFGDCWEWTSSAYLGYPGYRPAEGSLGEYNGKFMSGQTVLKGGSCLTPAKHIRASYRNFFSPETRWQFSGIRLAC